MGPVQHNNERGILVDTRHKVFIASNSFDENDKAITQLLDEKQMAFTVKNNDISSTSKRAASCTSGAVPEPPKPLVGKTDVVQFYANTKNWTLFFSVIKTRPHSSPVNK